MIEELVWVSDSKTIEQKHNCRNLYFGREIKAPFVIGYGDQVWTIAYEANQILNTMVLGYTNYYVEGKRETINISIDQSTEAFSYNRHMTAHHPKRCVVIADAFLVTGNDGTKYLVHPQSGERAIGLAGFYESWNDPNTGQSFVGCALVTSRSTTMLQKIGVYEMPILIQKSDFSAWLDPDYSSYEIKRIFSEKDERFLNAFPIRNNVLPGKVSWNQLKPVGERLRPFHVKRSIGQKQ